MPANTNPIFIKTPKTSWGVLTTANTAKDGTGTVVTVFEAGEFGARVEKIVFAHLGTNIQTVVRIFLNNGEGNNIPENNSLIGEVTIPENTLSENTAQNIIEHVFPDGLVLESGVKINLTIGTTVASGIQTTAINSGDF